MNNGIRLYFQRAVIVSLCLGFASGLPLVLCASTLSAWLSYSGVSKVQIGFLLSLSFPYAIKFLWAPIFDVFSVPILTKRIGNRKSWLLISEIFLCMSICFLAYCDVSDGKIFAISVFFVAFFSATQDTIVDSFRVSILSEDEQGVGASAYVTGYRIGMLVAGAGALIIVGYFSGDSVAWKYTYILLSPLVFVGFFSSLFVNDSSVACSDTVNAETEDFVLKLKNNFKILFVVPISDFVAKNNDWFFIILFIICFRIADAFIGSMFNPFLIEKGFTLTEIGIVVKSFGFFAALFGSLIGGYVTYYLGIRYALFASIIFQLFGNAMFFIQNHIGHNLPFLYVLVGIDNISGSISTSAMLAYLGVLCRSSKYLGTQYALLTSVGAIDRILSPIFSGIVANSGWFYFFALGMMLSVPSLILFFLLNKNSERFTIYQKGM